MSSYADDQIVDWDCQVHHRDRLLYGCVYFISGLSVSLFLVLWFKLCRWHGLLVIMHAKLRYGDEDFVYVNRWESFNEWLRGLGFIWWIVDVEIGIEILMVLKTCCACRMHCIWMKFAP